MHVTGKGKETLTGLKRKMGHLETAVSMLLVPESSVLTHDSNIFHFHLEVTLSQTETIEGWKQVPCHLAQVSLTNQHIALAYRFDSIVVLLQVNIGHHVQ